jgi:hypothetical protein
MINIILGIDSENPMIPARISSLVSCTEKDLYRDHIHATAPLKSAEVPGNPDVKDHNHFKKFMQKPIIVFHNSNTSLEVPGKASLMKNSRSLLLLTNSEREVIAVVVDW